jgi:hypothetical protein
MIARDMTHDDRPFALSIGPIVTTRRAMRWITPHRAGSSSDHAVGPPPRHRAGVVECRRAGDRRNGVSTLDVAPLDAIRSAARVHLP